VKKAKKNDVPKMQGKGPVRYRVTGPERQLALGIDFRLADPPQSYTYADSVSLKNDRDTGISTVLFGQANSNDTKAGECVSIVMPSVSLFGQFIPSAKGVEDTLATQLTALKLTSARRTVPSGYELRAVRFANVIFLATSLGEATLDFYYIPGRDLHFARLNGTDIGLEPVIRVIIPLPVLQYLFDLCRPFTQSSVVAAQDPRSTNRANAV
jgi:hypothetical protein